MAAALFAVMSCNVFDDAEYADIRELAPSQGEILIPKEGGKADIKVYSNGKVTVNVLGDEAGEWSEVTPLEFEGDGEINVSFNENPSFRRMVKLALELDGGEKKDTIYVRQSGVMPYLECAAPYKNVSGVSPGFAEFAIDTNIPLSDLSSTVEYISGGTDWITGVSPELGNFVAETAASSVEHTSKARITVSYVDGWDETLSVNLYVTSSNKDGKFGSKISLADVRNYAGKGVVEDDVYFDGVVISDFHSMNMALNPSTTYKDVDVTENLRTAYVQAEDGSVGFCLKFDNAKDNILVAGTMISIALPGLEVVKEEDPVRYVIKGVGGENMVASSAGSVPQPKVRKISALTDDDLYTWVSIPETEFVYKSGSYANVYENYTLMSGVNSMNTKNNNRLDGWASLLMDSEGKGIYAPVNMLCEWRRSGNGVPQGVGAVTGILVHEDMLRYGNLGRYQIRVVDESGFGQEWKGKSPYRDLAEWDGAPYQYRYGLWAQIDPKLADPGNKNARMNSRIPSDDLSVSNPVPRAYMTVENKVPGLIDYPLSSSASYAALTADDKGIVPSTPQDQYRTSLTITAEIKGWFQWEDNKITGYNGLRMDLSTEDITGTSMYVHYAFSVGAISAVTSQFFPAHWCLEYSIDGGKTYKICPDIVTGEEYVHLRTLPWWDVNISGVKYFTCSTCGLGSTDHVAMIPSDVFGKKDVAIRIRPYDNRMAVFPIEWDGANETGIVMHNTNVNSTRINFECIEIRYK